MDTIVSFTSSLTTLFAVVIVLAISVAGFWKGRQWLKNVDGDSRGAREPNHYIGSSVGGSEMVRVNSNMRRRGIRGENNYS